MHKVAKGEPQTSIALSIFDTYLNDFIRRGKNRTAQTYAKLLGGFSRWTNERDLSNFDEQDVIKFLEAQQWSDSSRNTFLAAIRGWAKHAKAKIPSGTTLKEIQRGREKEKMLERIITLKDYTVHREEKPALSLEQISTLFDAMDPDTSSLFWVLLWFGFRVGELKLIKKIDWELGRLEVETEKVGGSRALFFDKYTARLLRYAKDKGLLDLPDLAIWRRFKQYSGLIAPIKLTPHLARHCFATFFADIVNRDILRRLLGHGPRETTDIYVHPSEERIREAMVEKHYLKPLEGEDAGT